MPNALPTVSSLELLIPTLKQWQQTLNPVLTSPVPPRTPFNFRASGGAAGAAGITLNWEQVSGADGYEIQSSTNGDFSTGASTIATLTSIVATSFFDNTTVTGVKKWYRIRATNGSIKTPHTVKGNWSAPVYATSGSGLTTYDQISGNQGSAGKNMGGSYPGIGGRRFTF